VFDGPAAVLLVTLLVTLLLLLFAALLVGVSVVSSAAQPANAMATATSQVAAVVIVRMFMVKIPLATAVQGIRGRKQFDAEAGWLDPDPMFYPGSLDEAERKLAHRPGGRTSENSLYGERIVPSAQQVVRARNER